MKHILFFGTKQDLLPMLQLVESSGPIKYVRMGHFRQGAVEVCNFGSEIPDLGKATANSSINCESYLVCEPDTPVNLRPVGRAGLICIDQLVNPDTVTFTPAGILNEEMLLHGRVATVSDSKPAQYLMRRFHSAIKKNFGKIKAFYVGPNARTLFERGTRLTAAAQCPREFDLTLDFQ
jgi:hypothetical protein